jgi:predicted ABC-type ATPase
MKDVIVFGGPNGAGKTTAARSLLPGTLGIREFVNADEIARGLSPFNPDGSAFAAGRLMVERIRFLARSGESFAFETICAGRSHARLLRMCRAAGYRLILFFFVLPSPRSAIDRVARRVQEGGHGVPDVVVSRRYFAGLHNLIQIYLPLADIALIYDNSDHTRALIAERQPGLPFLVHDAAKWARIEEAAQWTR